MLNKNNYVNSIVQSYLVSGENFFLPTLQSNTYLVCRDMIVLPAFQFCSIHSKMAMESLGATKYLCLLDFSL